MPFLFVVATRRRFRFTFTLAYIMDIVLRVVQSSPSQCLDPRSPRRYFPGRQLLTPKLRPESLAMTPTTGGTCCWPLVGGGGMRTNDAFGNAPRQRDHLRRLLSRFPSRKRQGNEYEGEAARRLEGS